MRELADLVWRLVSTVMDQVCQLSSSECDVPEDPFLPWSRR